MITDNVWHYCVLAIKKISQLFIFNCGNIHHILSFLGKTIFIMISSLVFLFPILIWLSVATEFQEPLGLILRILVFLSRYWVEEQRLFVILDLFYCNFVNVLIWIMHWIYNHKYVIMDVSVRALRNTYWKMLISI